MPDGRIRVLIGVADVDARVSKGTVIDKHAAFETTSVYTGVSIFPMLPTELSEGITSLNENQDRAAIVVEYSIDASGTSSGEKAYRALVRNRAQLAYPGIGAWLDGKGAPPAKVAASSDLAAQLKLQDTAAQRMAGGRYQHGALEFETIETQPVLVTDEIVGIAPIVKNRATSLIEEFMVAANGVVARTFESAGLASIRRIVRVPKRWDRIVELAAQKGTTLPAEPDSKALNDFLIAQNQKDPDHFPDLSLAVIKLMGPGEYVLIKPNAPSPGHFGLAVRDYTHSTAPNRRFPDVVTQRVLKAWLTKSTAPYSEDDLNAIAQRCTRWKMPPARWSARWRNASPLLFFIRISGRAIRPSSPARRKRAPSCARSTRTSTAWWCVAQRALTLATESPSSSSTLIPSAAISISKHRTYRFVDLRSCVTQGTPTGLLARSAPLGTNPCVRRSRKCV